MKWQDLGETSCSLARTLSVIGDRWTLLILRNAFLRTRRFDAFQKQLGITRHLLAARLKKLVDDGILEKRAYQQRPVRYEYRLTEKGIDLYPVLLSLVTWGDKWMDDGNGPPVQYIHKDCGQITRPRLVCSECDEPVHARNLMPIAGPGAGARKAPAAKEKNRSKKHPEAGSP